MRAARPGIAAVVFVCLASSGAAQTSPEVQAGLALAKTHCGQCHSLDTVGPSPIPEAPPFRELHRLYPVDSLEEALAEGIMTGHPGMPEARFDPDQIRSLIAFLKSLE